MFSLLSDGQAPVRFFSGKGGVGKSSVVAGLACALAAKGERPLIVELGERRSMDTLFGTTLGDTPSPLTENVFGVKLRLPQTFEAYLKRKLKVGALAKKIAQSETLSPLFAAAPAVEEIAALSALTALAREWSPILVDLDATGHALMWLSIDSVFAELAGAGPLREALEEICTLLRDPARAALYTVTEDSELPLQETSEFLERVRQAQLIALGGVVLNRVQPSFSAADQARIKAMLKPARMAALPQLRPNPSPAAIARIFLSHPREFQSVLPPISVAPSSLSFSDCAAQTLFEERLIVCVGPGGVGKTSCAAAIAAASAAQGSRTLVLTIDPAKRLADALGLDGLTDEIAEIPCGQGVLGAAMLDTASSYDSLIRRITDEAHAETILANRVYRAFRSNLARAHAYIAMERLFDVLQEERVAARWDRIVLDTPPSRNAMEILDAPWQLARFLDDRVLRYFTKRTRDEGSPLSRLREFGGAATQLVLARILGKELVDDAIEFFATLAPLREGFLARAQVIQDQLQAEETSFLLVTKATQLAAVDAKHLLWQLRSRSLGHPKVLINQAKSDRAIEDAMRTLALPEAFVLPHRPEIHTQDNLIAWAHSLVVAHADPLKTSAEAPSDLPLPLQDATR